MEEKKWSQEASNLVAKVTRQLEEGHVKALKTLKHLVVEMKVKLHGSLQLTMQYVHRVCDQVLDR